MSDELRDELASIARGARKILERQGGGAELMALSAARARRERGATPVAEAGAMVADAVREAEAGPGPATDAPEPRPAYARRPVALSRSAAPVPAPEPAADSHDFAPSAAGRLYPADPAARAAIDRDSLPKLQEIAGRVVACTKCGLSETRTCAVPGVGSAGSGILFVGEAPGAEEDRRGEPFVGRAGELLTKIIQAMDDAKLIPGVPLSRQTVYIANVLKCRPPENRNPLPHEIESCSPYLLSQLEALKPRIICCLGKFAAELLLSVKGTIAGMRGKVYRYKGSKLIVTYHPAACLRNPNLKRPVWEDMQLLAREYLAD